MRKRRFLGRSWLDFNQVPPFFNRRIGFLTAVSAQELQHYDKPLVMKKSASRRRTRSKEGRDTSRGNKGVNEDPMQDLPAHLHHPSQASQGRTIHNGSAGAFEATERPLDEDGEDQVSDLP